MKVLHNSTCTGHYMEGVAAEIYNFLEDLVNNKFKRSPDTGGLPYDPDFKFYTVNLVYRNIHKSKSWASADEMLYYLFNKSRLRNFVSLWLNDYAGQYFMVTPYIQVRYITFDEWDYGKPSICYKFAKHCFWPMLSAAYSLLNHDIVIGDVGFDRDPNIELNVVGLGDEKIKFTGNTKNSSTVNFLMSGQITNLDEMKKVIELDVSKPSKELYKLLCIWPELYNSSVEHRALDIFEYVYMAVDTVRKCNALIATPQVFPRMKEKEVKC